jgi:hypothetical protein
MAAMVFGTVLRKSGERAKMRATDGEDAGDQQPAGEPEPVDPAGDGQPANLEDDATQGEVLQADKDADEVEGVS